MHSCLLVGGAPTEHKGLDLVLKNFMFDAIIAVDAGYAALVERGVAPHHAFGDFDSLGFRSARSEGGVVAFTLSILTKTSPIWTSRSTSRSMKDSRISSCATASMRASIIRSLTCS